MIILRRPYTGAADKEAMLALVRQWLGEWVHTVDLPYRLSSWALDAPEQVALWEDGAGALLAWAVLQTPFWALDYAFTPAARDYGLLPMILTWAIGQAGRAADGPYGRPFWFAGAFADATDQLGDLERAGFVRQDNVPVDPFSQVLMERPGDVALPEAALPRGFTIRPLAGAGEVAAYVACHRAASGGESMTAAWRTRTLMRPEYRPDRDLVVEAPGGDLVGFCVCWLGEDGRVGQVAPLGVHPAYRRRGLGRAVLTEGLRRMAARGATRLTVETGDYRVAAFALYGSLGFRVVRRIIPCRRDFPVPPAS